MACYDIYSEQLANLRRGFALWEPDPAGRYDQVEVGDVGYILYGSFQRLFSIIRPASHPSQIRGVPECFEPLVLPEEHPIICRTLLAGRHMSQGMHHVEASVGASGVLPGVAGAGVQVEFQCHQSAGAVLVTPDTVQCQDVLHRKAFEAYMRTNADYWIAFVDRLQLGVKEEDIMLVTGRDLTTSWAMATFKQDARDVRVSLEIEFAGGSGSMASRFAWSSDQHVEHNAGPHIPSSAQILAPAEDDAQPSTTAVVQTEPINLRYNQCVFLRCYRWKKRRLLPKKLYAAAMPEDLDEDRDTRYPEVNRIEGGSGSSDDGLELIMDPNDNEYASPYTVLLDSILKDSNVEIAIVHDEDLFPYLDALKDAESLSFQDLAHRINLSQPEIRRDIGLSETSSEGSITGPRSSLHDDKAVFASSERGMHRYLDLEDVPSCGEVIGEGVLLEDELVRLLFDRSTLSEHPQPARQFSVLEVLSTTGNSILYRVIELLPRSAMPHTNDRPIRIPRTFIMKLIPKVLDDETELAAQKAEAALRLSLPIHINILTLYRVLETSTCLLLLLEYVPGKDLFSLIEQETIHGLSLEEPVESSRNNQPTFRFARRLDAGYVLSDSRLRSIASIFCQVCKAVAVCHEAGVYHRNITPQNILATTSSLNGRADQTEGDLTMKLYDFRLATSNDVSKDMDCGSAPYISYECKNNLTPTYRPRAADIWSLGIVLINLIYQCNPWVDTTEGACSSFTLFRGDPLHFFMDRFIGMTLDVAQFLVTNVFCIVEDPSIDSQRISARDFGVWAQDLPTMLGPQSRILHSTSAPASISVLTASQSGRELGGVGGQERKHKDNATQRAMIVRTIVETERAYVQGLQELNDIYIKPSSAPVSLLGNFGSAKDTIIPDRERKLVFGGLESLLAFHTESFLPELEKAANPLLKTPQELEFADADGQLSMRVAIAVANIFVSSAQSMKMCYLYMNDLDNSIQRITFWVSDRPDMSSASSPLTPSPASSRAQMISTGLETSAISAPRTLGGFTNTNLTLSRSQRKRIKTFLERCRLDPRHSELDLEHYLSLPTQRMSRCRSLLEELARVTPSVSFDSINPLDKAAAEISSPEMLLKEGDIKTTNARRKRGRRKGKVPMFTGDAMSNGPVHEPTTDYMLVLASEALAREIEQNRSRAEDGFRRYETVSGRHSGMTGSQTSIAGSLRSDSDLQSVMSTSTGVTSLSSRSYKSAKSDISKRRFAKNLTEVGAGKPPGSSITSSSRTPPNVKVMDGVPWELTELPRHPVSNPPTFTDRHAATISPARTTELFKYPVEALSLREGLTPFSKRSASPSSLKRTEASSAESTVDQRRAESDAESSQNASESGQSHRSGDKGQVNPLARMLSALRRNDSVSRREDSNWRSLATH